MIKTFTWDRERREIEIDPQQVKSFSLTNRKERTVKGTFKKFYKVGHITMTNGEHFAVSERVIKEVKDILNGEKIIQNSIWKLNGIGINLCIE